MESHLDTSSKVDHYTQCEYKKVCDLFFPLVEVDNPEIAFVTKRESQEPKGGYSDTNVYDVTCIHEGTTKVTFIVGNNPSSTNS